MRFKLRGPEFQETISLNLFRVVNWLQRTNMQKNRRTDEFTNGRIDEHDKLIMLSLFSICRYAKRPVNLSVLTCNASAKDYLRCFIPVILAVEVKELNIIFNYKKYVTE